jgi:(p)ppGpp synthase/HD superfamily hydrolase
MPSREERSDSPLLGRKFADALTFAFDAHIDQTRKGGDIPYIGHLLGVCSLVIEEGGSEDAAIAALLHDAVEDQGGQEMLDEISANFGDVVGDIVQACSDTLITPKPPWHQRKEEYLAHLDTQPRQVLLVSLADKLFNARAILRDHRKVGDELWGRFKGEDDTRPWQQVRDDQLWYYRSLSETFTRVSPEVHMASELKTVVAEHEASCAGWRDAQSGATRSC